MGKGEMNVRRELVLLLEQFFEPVRVGEVVGEVGIFPRPLQSLLGSI